MREGGLKATPRLPYYWARDTVNIVQEAVTGLDRCGKSHLPPGFDSRIVQPLSVRYERKSLAGSSFRTVGSGNLKSRGHRVDLGGLRRKLTHAPDTLLSQVAVRSAITFPLHTPSFYGAGRRRTSCDITA